VILAAGAAIPWLAFHYDKHVQLASFIGYVGILVILNVVCITEAWGMRRRSAMPAAQSKEATGNTKYV
jgi:hypothetical protein